MSNRIKLLEFVRRVASSQTWNKLVIFRITISVLRNYGILFVLAVAKIRPFRNDFDLCRQCKHEIESIKYGSSKLNLLKALMKCIS